jgi:hypothetical protein
LGFGTWEFPGFLGHWSSVIGDPPVMPVKALHIFFITAALVLALGLAAWSYQHYVTSGERFFLAYAGGSVVSGAVLFGYVIYFWKKTKQIR